MDLQALRHQIDGIDSQLVSLFTQRMEIAGKIADCKKSAGLPVFVPEREQEKLNSVEALAGDAMALYVRALYARIFELSRDYQEACIQADCEDNR